MHNQDSTRSEITHQDTDSITFGARGTGRADRTAVLIDETTANVGESA